MHVGYAPLFQNPENVLSDAAIYDEEVRLTELAEPLGFDSVWSIEHHFTDYTMCPDVVQFLSYMAGHSKKIQLGTMVIVLPWHDPIRVAEQISLLDHLSKGRLILGLGRGLGRVEYEGFRLDMDTGRNRFVEHAELVLGALETGSMEGGSDTQQPRRDIRPFPLRTFLGRTFAAAVSPESMPIMAKLGTGLLVIPQKPWSVVREDFRIYSDVYRKTNGAEPPQPMCGGFYFVDENADRAEEMANKWIGKYYHTAMKHYEMTAEHFGKAKGYEFYSHVGKYIDRHGAQGAADDFVKLMPWGTPEQVIEKLQFIRDTIDMRGIMCHFSFAGMPFAEAERNLRCFAKHVLPEVKRWDAPPIAIPDVRAMPIPSHAA